MIFARLPGSNFPLLSGEASSVHLFPILLQSQVLTVPHLHISSSGPQFCLHCVCVCIVLLGDYACGGQRWMLGGVLNCSSPYSRRQLLSLSLVLPDWVSQPGSEIQGPSCLCLPGARVTDI